MTTQTFLSAFAALTLLAACQPQQNSTTQSDNVSAQAQMSEPQQPTASQPAAVNADGHTEAEIRAAQNAPAPQQLTATRTSLVGGAAGTGSASGGLNANVSQLTGNVTGLAAKETDQGLELDMSSDVLFDFDKADIKAEALPVLEKAAEIIRSHGKGAVAVTGHTDSKGDDAYNLQLSLKRAQSVKNWFAENGLTNEFTVEGKGETEPVADNQNSDGSDNPEGRAQNRRVGILVKTMQKIGSGNAASDASADRP